MGIGPMLFYSLSALSPLLVAELGLSKTEYGALASVMFVAAALSSIVSAKVMNMSGTWLAIWFLVAGGTLAMFVAAGARNYGILLLSVVISGIIQSLSHPVTNRLVADLVPAVHQGISIGIKQAGVQVIQAACGLFQPWLALFVGWRGAIAAFGAGSFALGAVLLSRFVPRQGGRITASAMRGQRPKLSRRVLGLAGFACFAGAAQQAGNVHIPLFGHHELGLSVTEAGLLVVVVGGVGVAARIGWGRLSQRLGSKLSMYAIAVGGAASISLLLLSNSYYPVLVWAGVGLFGATGVAANVVVMVGVVHAVPPELVGRASSVVSMGMFVGFAAGPVGVGALVDLTGSYVAGWGAVVFAYALAAGMAYPA